MSEDLLPRLVRRESLGSSGSHESGDSAVDLHPTFTVAASPVGTLNPDIERLVDNNPTHQGSADSASARFRLEIQQDRETAIREASEHLERCRFYAEHDNEMSAEEVAKLADFRAGLLAARIARVTNGTPAPALATTTTNSLSEPRQDSTAMYNMRDVVVLEKLIDVALAEKFREQARKPKFRTHWSDVILPEALDLIKLRLNNMQVELGMTREAADAWTPEGQTLLAVAEMICDLFGRPTRTETTVEITDFIYDFNFGFKLEDRSYEETSVQNFRKLLKDHFGAIQEIEPGLQHSICKLLYKKFPKHSEISDYLKVQTAQEVGTGQDTVEKCLDRMSSSIQHMRRMVTNAMKWAGTRGLQYMFFSGSTKQGQNVHSSTNTHISDSTARGCRHAIGVYAAYRQSTTEYRMTPGPSKPATYADLYNRSKPQGTSKPTCATCGRVGHPREACRYFMNDMCNNTHESWEDSAVGMAFKREGYPHFRPHVKLQNYRMSTDERGVMPVGWRYPTEEDNIGQDLPGKYQKTTHHGHAPSKGPYKYDRATHDKSKDLKKKPRCETPSRYIIASMTPVHTNEYIPVSISLTQTMREDDGCPKNRKGVAPTPRERVSYQEPRSRRKLDQLSTGSGRNRVTESKTGKIVRATALLDTGSLAGDFINAKVLQELGGAHHLRSSDTPILVCSGLDNTCISSNVILDVDVTFIIQKMPHTIQLCVRISDNSPVDLIIGRDTIRKNNLVHAFPDLFFGAEEQKKGYTPVLKRKLSTCTHVPNSGNCKNKCITEPTEHNSVAEPITLPDTTTLEQRPMTQLARAPQPSATRSTLINDTPLDARADLITPPTSGTVPTQTRRPVTALLRETEQLLEKDDFGDEGINYNTKDMFAPFRPEPTGPTADPLDKITISGTAEQQRRIRQLCEKYRHLFKDTLDAAPANLTPFELDVDKKKWETYKNRGHVRQQSAVKEAEINRQVQEMLTSGIIEKSNATYYSQVMLTPKPNGDYRFCVDYRNMNDATESASWPIPNIAALLARLGKKKADTFGVMDLTSGYHQAPLSLATRAFTAFITFAGVFQFTRLPFGPKRAPSYFQQEMATAVLGGLIYHICEMYLDDCIVYGTGTDEFCKNLEKVFIRFEAAHLFLKASKCKLGLSEVEYVGKTISKAGITMSQKQIQGVMDFPKPQNNTQLRSYLGFVNYFRDHVPNHSNVVAPLHKMIDHSAKKQSKLTWTPEGATAFEHIKQLISRSPMLYFIHDTAPITLMTDASDYGVGGYLYQEIDGQKQLVALVSKALTPTQLRWSVIQKEAYGIFFCCTQLDAMLRDRKFTIMTDHKNLMFIKHDSNPMVVRWWMALQELDFSITYIKGDTNMVADALSRLCLNRKEESKYLLAALYENRTISSEHYKSISACHNSMVGHGGLERTMRKLKQLKLHWEAMRADVREFIRKCPCCQKMSQIKPPVVSLKYTTSTYRPMECLNIDFIGPFPDKGYILVVICTFTRWVELYPVPVATAATTLQALLTHFGRYGAPTYIRSDNGPQFISEVIKQFFKVIGVEQNLTTPYSSEENAIVERCNKEVNRHITAFTFDRTTTENYQEILPFVQRILNSSINSRMKVSPAQLMFGNSIDLDRDILLPADEHLLPAKSLTRSLDQMLHTQQNLTRIARELLIQSDKEHNEEIHESLTEFAIGSFVLAQPRTQPATRMHTAWTGPYKVITFQKGQYKVLDLITHKHKQYHVSQLKPFYFNPTQVDPADIARRDHLEYFVEDILAFDGDIKRVSTLTFHVKWLGCDESQNTWERWGTLKDTEQLHKYLISVNLKHLIPRKFQLNYL